MVRMCSDAETRRLAKPFEVRELTLHVLARPGQPLALDMHGTIVADAPGELSAHVELHGPFRGGALPFASAEAKVSVKGFSSAMVDGLIRIFEPR